MADGGDVVAIRKILHDLDVGGEPRPCKNALEQIVAEESGLGNSPLQGAFECVDLIDALAGEGALAEEILIDVRDGGCVGVDAAGAGERAETGAGLEPDGGSGARRA